MKLGFCIAEFIIISILVIWVINMFLAVSEYKNDYIYEKSNEYKKTFQINNIIVPLLQVIIIALSALVIEDLFKVSQDDPQAILTRYGPLLILIAIYILLLRFRNLIKNIDSDRGTFYYVRFNDFNFKLNHSQIAREKGDQAMNFQVLRRGFSLEQDIKQDKHGVKWIDARNSLSQLSYDLDIAMNMDSDESFHTIAPDLAWPAALALGYDLVMRPKLNLVELPMPGKKETFKFSFPPPEKTDSENKPGDPTLCNFKSKTIPGEKSETVMSIELTKLWTNEEFSETSFSDFQRIRICATDGDEMDKRILLNKAGSIDDARPNQLCVTEVELNKLIKELFEIFSTTLDTLNEPRKIHLVLFVPKIIAVILGYEFKNIDKFWDKIIPYHFDFETKSYFPMLVHQSQNHG